MAKNKYVNHKEMPGFLPMSGRSKMGKKIALVGGKKTMLPIKKDTFKAK